MLFFSSVILVGAVGGGVGELYETREARTHSLPCDIDRQVYTVFMSLLLSSY